MAIATTLRNRLVGFLIIISLLLIALPALLGKSPQQRPADAQALNTHGAVSEMVSENPNATLNSQEGDYATLLAPEDDSKQGLISENEELMSALKNEVNDGSQGAPQGQLEELTYSKPNQQVLPPPEPKPTAPAKPQEEILVAPKKPQQNKVTAQTAPKAPAKTQASSSKGGFTIQVGVFSQKANAQRVVSTLQQAGISARTFDVVSNGKTLTRVYAGDSGDRASLESLLKRINEVAKVNGRIVPKS